MKNCLVMLTKVYPFDKGEEFIEDELPTLAAAFEKVILLATSTAKNAVQTRQVPSNVQVYQITADRIQKQLPKAILGLLVSRSRHGFLSPEERREPRSLKARLFSLYFIAKSECVFAECRRLLLPEHLETYAGVTYYSFWLYDVAVAACELKKHSPAKACRAVSRAHRYDLYAEMQPCGYLPLRPFLLKNLDAVYPCSENGTQYLLRRFPAASEKVRTAYLGTRDFGLGPDPDGKQIHLVSCCHISPVKRVELLAQALVLLKDSGLSLKWTHIGAGDRLESLRSFTRENLSFMQVELPGALPNQKLMEYYHMTPVDFFINTSSSEGLPVSIMEAASFGIPAIATDVGGTGELVRTNETGWLLPAHCTPEMLAQIIQTAANLPQDAKQTLRKACRALWEENFQASRNYERFAAEIQQSL